MKWRWLALAGALLVAGCFQLDTTIRLNEDGSAVVTERVNFSRRLLDMAQGDSGPAIEGMLSREAAEARAKRMGKGVTLVRHEVRDGSKGSRELVAEYRVEDISQFLYDSPFLVSGGGGIQFGMKPYYTFVYPRYVPGQVYITLTPVALAGVVPETNAPAEVVSGNAPLDLQTVRDMVPLFADMLQEVQLRLRLECYAPIQMTHGLALRDWSAGTKCVDLINVSGRNMDQRGYPLLHNEEVVRELLMGKIAANRDSPAAGVFIGAMLGDMAANGTLPLFNQGERGDVGLPASRPLFQRYFEGKKVDWRGAERRDLAARGEKLADFAEIGGWPQSNVTNSPVAEDRCPADCPWCQEAGDAHAPHPKRK
jgi:hypothetical protein